MEALGINPVLLIAQIISFLILYWVFRKFLYGYIQKALEDRRDKVSKIFTDKEELENRLAKLEKDQAEKLKEMQIWKKKFEAEVRKEAEEIKGEIVSKAAAEGERELAKAKERIDQEVRSVKKELTSEVTNLAKSMVDQLLTNKTEDTDWQKKELEKSIRNL
jgi:F-type H+-transporting ATPase subunit b